MLSNTLGRKIIQWLQRPTTIVAIFVFIGLLAMVGVDLASQRILSGVYVAGLPVGGKTPEEVEELLSQRVEQWRVAGFVFTANGESYTVKATLVGLSGTDVAIELVSFDIVGAAKAAALVGHRGPWWVRLADYTNADLGRFDVAIPVSVRRAEVTAILHQEFEDKETLVVEPRYELRDKAIVVLHGSSGREFSYDQAIDTLANNLAHGINQPITLVLRDKNTRRDPLLLVQAKPQVERLLRQEISVTDDTQVWRLPTALAVSALYPEKNGEDVSLVVDQSALSAWWSGIVKAVNRHPQAAKFELEGNRAVRFELPVVGRAVDLPASQQQVMAAITRLTNGTNPQPKTTVPLIVTITEPPYSAVAAEYGIKELIGIAKTSFAGSPTNRRHNIAVGADKLNGLLVAPDEIFSALAALRPFTVEAGYRAELVIKGNQTIPEVGGGLCQIGTTLFRATLNAGLPIMSRQNHSYRVPYYEPPVGMDATIYDPVPDFSFRNDTGQHILLKARVEGDFLTIEFWGTKDERVAQTTTPVVTNQTDPPPTKYIETLDLKPGEQKCTERAHPGARAVFNYVVTYPDGRETKREFKSYYRPWQAVCLVGVEKLQPKADPPLAESEPPAAELLSPPAT